jgi:hypothetical protein
VSVLSAAVHRRDDFLGSARADPDPGDLCVDEEAGFEEGEIALFWNEALKSSALLNEGEAFPRPNQKKQGERKMKKTAMIIAAVSFALSAPLTSFAMDHDSMPMEHGSMEHQHGGHTMGNVAHEEVVDGVKATFSVLDYKGKMKEMGMKETHHIMVVFKDAKSGKSTKETKSAKESKEIRVIPMISEMVRRKVKSRTGP